MLKFSPEKIAKPLLIIFNISLHINNFILCYMYFVNNFICF
jgi:hypothetical protein